MGILMTLDASKACFETGLDYPGTAIVDFLDNESTPGSSLHIGQFFGTQTDINVSIMKRSCRRVHSMTITVHWCDAH